MTLVKMLETKLGSNDGIHVLELEKGKVYDLSERLAQRYLDRDVAESAAKDAAAETPSLATPAPPGAASGSAHDPSGNADPDGGLDASGGIAVDTIVDPLEGLNAKQAAAAIAKLGAEQLDAIPESEDRKTVLEAIEKRRAELAG